MDFKRSLVKITAVLSLVFAGSALVSNVPANTQTVQAASKSASQQRAAVVKLVKKEIGKPYVWGATGPSAFDCSGLTSYVFKNAIGKVLPRTTYGQITIGKSVSLKNLKPGDLLFWGNYHVAIYVGNGKYVHAPAPGQNVKEQTLASFYPSQAKRVIN